MSKGIRFFIYLLERYAEHLDVTADVAYRRLAERGLVDYAMDMYELYHVEALENAFADLDRRLAGGAKAWRVSSSDEVSRLDFDGLDILGVTSSASTPESLFQAVLRSL